MLFYMAQTALPHLGSVIDKHLEVTDLSRRALAARTGIPHTTLLRRFAAGGFTVPELAAIANVLDVTVSTLVTEAEQVAA